MAQVARGERLVNGAVLGETTFAALGVLFLLSAIRTFTSTLYMSLFGNVPNETVGASALGVFAASVLAAIAGWRLGPRASVALSGALLAGGTVFATASRWNWADIVFSATALVGGTWWLALAHSARSGSRGSPFVIGLPMALAADVALRAAFRTVPVVDLAPPLAIALTAAATLIFIAAGIATYSGEREWTSPGARGALALAAIPALVLVGETGGTDPVQVLGAAGLGGGPEGPGSVYAGLLLIGGGMTGGAIGLSRARRSRRIDAAAALGVGAVLLWAHVPVLSALSGIFLGLGLVIAAAVLPDTASRPARSPLAPAIALSAGWVIFVALAFVFYAYYALPAAAWVATGIVVLGLLAAMPLPEPRLGGVGAIVVGVLAVVVPLGALLTTPSAPTESRPSFRLMTYNVHQGFDEGNIPALDRIAATIAAESPDVVVLQEVVRGWMIGEQHDALTVLSERLGMQYVFGPAIGDAYGNAVLSRLPVSDVRYIRYERQPQLRHQPRGAILFSVSDVLVIATHLDHVDGATEVRQGQVHAILAAWNGTRPAIVAGDLNALPGTAELKLLEEAGFRDLAKDGGADQPTSPATDPRHRIDYVWGIGIASSQAHTVASNASDHRPLVVNISRK